MYRPFVICQMMMTIDGRIDGEFYNNPAYPPAVPVFHNCYIAKGETRYPCEAHINGKATMQKDILGYDKPDMDENAPLVPEGDYWPKEKVEGEVYWISISNTGDLNWKQNFVNYASRDLPAIEVITSQASNAYKAYLRKLELPYLICGDGKRVDVKILLTKLKELGFSCIALAGGGTLNWAWIQEGVIDELSLVMCPVGEGNSTKPSVFSTGGADISNTIGFKLKKVEACEGGVVYLNYECPNSDLGYK